MNIVITGASSGIGLRTAEKLAVEGHRVFNISRNRCGVPHVTDVLADLSRADAIAQAIHKITHEVGRLDAGIYCAGYAIAGALRDVEPSEIECITQVNYLSATTFTRAMEQAMRHRGRVILMGSLAGELPLPYQPYYSATKAALIMFTRSLSMEWHNTAMSVCCLIPGGVCTAFSRHRQKTYGKADNPNLNAAIASVTDVEQGGILADDVADKLISLLNRTKMPVLASPGLGSKITYSAARMLPSAFVNMIMMKKFNQRKDPVEAKNESTSRRLEPRVESDTHRTEPHTNDVRAQDDSQPQTQPFSAAVSNHAENMNDKSQEIVECLSDSVNEIAVEAQDRLKPSEESFTESSDEPHYKNFPMPPNNTHPDRFDRP